MIADHATRWGCEETSEMAIGRSDRAPRPDTVTAADRPADAAILQTGGRPHKDSGRALSLRPE
jgi:hypothetical protein